MGYHRAGFDIVGVDIHPQPRYPFAFVQAEAVGYIRANGSRFAAIHASPPCQGYSRLRHLPWLRGRTYPLLIDVTRAALVETGRPWVIENVADAPLSGAVLCGAALGLPISRHRRFESSILLMFPPCPGHPVMAHGRAQMAVKYRGHGITGVRRGLSFSPPIGCGHTAGWRMAAAAMGIDWMVRSELTQAIPPAYTEYIGRCIIGCLGDEPASYNTARLT